jgi:hypothetical protein
MLKIWENVDYRIPQQQTPNILFYPIMAHLSTPQHPSMPVF